MTPAVALTDISLTREGRPVLSGLSLSLAPGQRLGICGPNGTGKTTLLRVIAGLERPQGGEIRLFGGLCATEADFRRARPAIGFLFQESDDQLFCPTVAEDIAFGPLNQGLTAAQARDRAFEMLEEFALTHLADRPVHHLSGGEKRLVCLAGLMAMRPQVLLLDEPTNALDGAAFERLVRHLDAFQGAMLLTSHDLTLHDRLGAARTDLVAGSLRAAA